MKVLVYSSSSLYNPQFGIEMDEAIKFYKQGCDVFFCFCDNCLSICSSNVYGNKAMCSLCQKTYANSLSQLPSEISIYPLSALNKTYADSYLVRSIDDIKKYTYKGVEIGYSALSFYITKTRNPNPTINSSFIRCISTLLNQSKVIVDSVEKAIADINPDKIVFFNGRFFETKPLHDLSCVAKIDFLCTENIGGIRTDEQYKVVHFENTLPHDLLSSFIRCNQSWEQSSCSEEEKLRLGSEFYIKRRDGIKAGDIVYTSNQMEGLVPSDYNSSKINIVIYCSSEDEMAAISSKYEKYKLFQSQYEGIRCILENFKNDTDYHFYLRIHPHLANIKFSYHLNLYQLQSYDNITIIPADDPISSYALMDIADSVIVFESTVGAEAVYWGKPVIVLAGAAYYHFNMCSVPKSVEELICDIKNPRVYVNSRLLAIKYGYYLLHNSLAFNSSFITITPKQIKIFKKKFYIFEYLKINHSALRQRLLYMIYHRVLSLFCVNTISYPDKIRQ